MTPERYRQIGEIYHATLELGSAERPGFLDRMCGQDLELRRAVESLLEAHEHAGGFLASPVSDLAAALIADATTPSLSGRRISHYQVLSRLGSGGMGEVYLAQDVRLERKVALKWLAAQFTADVDRVRRFEQEARAASALNHPNIVTIHDIGAAENGRYLVMELVEGHTLRALLARGEAADALARIGEQIAGALAVAHAAGITHRDIKPENIMVRDDGYVKVLDFGLARLAAGSDPLVQGKTGERTSPGALLGTLKYMSPEQARGESVLSSSDVFSLGLVFYEMATGKHPFATPSALGTLNAIASQAPIPPASLNPQLSSAVDALIVRMLAKDARLRPSAAEVASELRESPRPISPLEGSPLSARPGSHSFHRHTVGHEKERAELRTAFAAAAAGHGVFLGVVGEPGIGKTTLVDDFLGELTSSGKPACVARGRSSERLAGTEAYMPWLEILEGLCASDLGDQVVETMKRLAPTWFLQISPRPDDSSGERLQAERALSQERMKRELRAFFQTLAQRHPLVLVLEDLHWADVSTVDLLAVLADRLPAMAMLLVTTYRPSDMLLARHPFLRLRPDLQTRGIYGEIVLGFLEPYDIERYLALEFPGHRFPGELSAMVHARTEGNPLFMTDLLRYLRERRILAVERGCWVLAGSVSNIERDIPESVRAMIERKSAQLSDADRRLLVAASVQGCEFDSAIVAEVLGIDPATIEERLEALERVHAFARLVSERPLPDRTLSLRYRFIHALYQNALYGSLQPTRKAQWSLAVARSLEGHSKEEVAGVATELAALYEAAREYGQAAKWFQVSAERAHEIFASREALQLASRGLAMVDSLPHGRERIERELSLRLVLGNTLIATRGYAAPEVERNYSRARDLCGELGDTPHRLPVLCGLCFYHNCRGEYSKAVELGGEFLRLAERLNDPAVVVAHRMAGNPLLFCGELHGARTHYERAVSLYDPARHRPLTWLYGAEPGMNGRVLLGIVLWLLGYPDLALERTRDARRLAGEVSHANTRAYAYCYAGMQHVFRREWQIVEELAESAVLLSREQGFPMWLAHGQILRGRVMAERGQPLDGIAEIRRGLEAARSSGTVIHLPFYFSLLAEACAKSGRTADGLEALAEGLAVIETTAERYWEAEFHRLRGELALLNGEAPGEAEISFHRAIEVSERQGAKSLELRATMSLARLWRDWGKSDDARHRLAEIYGWFTEGFETADLREAAALLERASPIG